MYKFKTSSSFLAYSISFPSFNCAVLAFSCLRIGGLFCFMVVIGVFGWFCWVAEVLFSIIFGFIGIKSSFMDVKRSFMDVKRSFMDVKKSFMDVKRSFMDVKRSFMDVKGNLEGVKSF